MKRILAAALLAMAAGPALAQRAGENANAAAQDAFGVSVGGEVLGLYDASDVRGFSPAAAGNIRLEGLYIDRQGDFTTHLFSGSAIRVGPAALGYPFPAPTGIADYALRKPGEATALSAVVKGDGFGGWMTEADGALALSNDIGVAAGIGYYRHALEQGGDSTVVSGAVVPRWRLSEDLELVPLFAYIRAWDENVRTTLTPAGDELPDHPSPRELLAPAWAERGRRSLNYGLTGNGRAAGWALKAGAFRSEQSYGRDYSSQYRNVSPDGVGEQVVAAIPARRFASTSGEVRASRSVDAGSLRHGLVLAVRGREQTRRYGGARSVSFGTGDIGAPTPRKAPEFATGPQTRERLRQTTIGAAYELTWRDRASATVGVQKTNFRKRTDAPAGPDVTSRDDPWLYNASASVRLNRRASAYAAYARGVEEGPVAPEIALNRDAAPPPIRTEQMEAGLAVRLTADLQVVAGVFQIDKPYYDLDGGGVFRSMGEVRHRGLELSVAGEIAEGLRLVAGAVLMDPEVSRGGDARALRPVGTPRRSAVVSLDWRPAWSPAWSFDVAVDQTGRRPVRMDGSLEAPAVTLVDLGFRYRFKVAGAPAVLRGWLSNALQDEAWNVVGAGAVQPGAARQANLRLTVDF